MGSDHQRSSGYRPSWKTDVMATLKKYGFKPMTTEERAKKLKPPLPATSNVRYLPKRTKA